MTFEGVAVADLGLEPLASAPIDRSARGWRIVSQTRDWADTLYRLITYSNALKILTQLNFI